MAVTGLAKADNSFSEIDLTSFQDIPSIIDACDVPIENVSCSTRPNCRRFYITGLWGVSAATLKQDYNFTPPDIQNNTENIFTAGIAGGVSFERQRGRLRVEAEWLQRDFWADPYVDFLGARRIYGTAQVCVYFVLLKAGQNLRVLSFNILSPSRFR